jgi:hypothetical protein
MPPAGSHFFALSQPFFLGLLLALGLLIALIEIGIIGYAYEKMGVQRRYVFAVPVFIPPWWLPPPPCCCRVSPLLPWPMSPAAWAR